MQCKVLNSLLQLTANAPGQRGQATLWGGETIAQVIAIIVKIDLPIPSCIAGGGTSPSLDSAVQEEHGHPKGEKWGSLCLALTFLWPCLSCNRGQRDKAKNALHWLKVEMGWTLPAMNGNTLINLNPWRNRELDPH